MTNVNWNPSARHLRQFAAISLPAFFLLGLLAHRQLAASGEVAAWTVAAVAWTLGACTGICGLVRPSSVLPVYRDLMLIAYPFGWVITHTMLALVYFLIFTPAGWLLRRFRRDPLCRGYDASLDSYWIKRPPSRAGQDRYFRPF